ncbi:MAG: phosphodiester glycosidase family protein [Phycisphaerae bacterium]|nr:phosphodiester glycosidase family protein [Phycisphaerae bacterium]
MHGINGHRIRGGSVIAALCWVGLSPALAQTTQPATTQPVAPFRNPVDKEATRPYPALELTYERYEQPRPLRVWVARIDLKNPDVQLVATCGSEEVQPEFETRCERTLDFAKRRNVQFAVNASAFGPLRKKSGEPMQVVGLGACEGHVYSPPDERFGAFIVRKDGRIRIGNPPYDLEQVDEAVSGFHMLIENGQDVVERTASRQSPGFVGVNPRTAVGVDKEGETLWLAVFDGRQKGISEGITLYELGRYFTDLGAYQALNFDGGGSSTMVVQDPKTGEHRIVNTPSDNPPRLVANNLGVILVPPAKAPTTQPVSAPSDVPGATAE